MISVPDSIKEKLHLDHCQKNIRIHFPNGERSDICNDLIVKDSVSFTESICSKDALKFGLCEAPVFECEVVGVGYIKGAEIEVLCEVCCDPSVPGAEWKTDLQCYVYSIPLGSFLVTDCKRQADLNHRRITAYGGQARKIWEPLNVEKKKLNNNGAQYTPIIPFFLASNNIYFFDDIVDESAQAWTGSSTYYGIGESALINSERWSSTRVKETYVQMSYQGKYMQWGGTGGETNYQNLFRIEADYVSTREQFKTVLGELISRWGTATESILDTFASYAFDGVVFYQTGTGAGGWRAYVYGGISHKYLYPFINGLYVSNSAYTQYSKPEVVEIRIGHYYTDDPSHDYTDETIEFRILSRSPEIYVQSIKSSAQVLNITWPIETKKNAVYSYYRPTFDDVDLRELSNAFAELQGGFAYIDRYGNGRFINIKRQFERLPSESLYPGADVYPDGVIGGRLLPNDYQSCWYDDEYEKPFGAITCTYRNTSDEDVTLIYYLTGFDGNTDPDTYKVYDFSSNIIINAYSWTQAQIEAICQIIADNISSVTYMPVEFVGRGLPYVEAGDTFEILTKSNDSITTIVLNRTLTGEQTLTDTYKSV